ncbi:Cyclin-C [Auxenochlorella protothecoides]|uniref:Cyclin-C n=1 Tax=Auxenochlorella protothecoides TaxID=3075 RepID=A0A087SAU8_AUXPR|nr:Cyclin-C [Auxenochlorella protothecoides]KFM22852.1 Cyclin-C [Auxenochlorella protothecoides]
MTAMGCVARKDGAPLLRRRVVSTAALYFRWFYADDGFAGADPRALSLAALFLASKVEEMPVHAKGLMHTATTLGSSGRWHAPAALAAVLAAEAQLVAKVNVALLVFDPIPSLLEGLTAAGLQANQAVTRTAWWGVVEGGGALLNDSYLSRCHLLHPPHTIALACIILAAGAHGIDIEEWVAGLQADHAQVYEVGRSLLGTLAECSATITPDTCLRYLALLRLPVSP